MLPEQPPISTLSLPLRKANWSWLRDTFSGPGLYIAYWAPRAELDFLPTFTQPPQWTLRKVQIPLGRAGITLAPPGPHAASRPEAPGSQAEACCPGFPAGALPHPEEGWRWRSCLSGQSLLCPSFPKEWESVGCSGLCRADSCSGVHWGAVSSGLQRL